MVEPSFLQSDPGVVGEVRGFVRSFRSTKWRAVQTKALDTTEYFRAREQRAKKRAPRGRILHIDAPGLIPLKHQKLDQLAEAGAGRVHYLRRPSGVGKQFRHIVGDAEKLLERGKAQTVFLGCLHV